MQEVQPKIEALKEKHKDDQARLAQETMKIWKEHKVHPLSSCAPPADPVPYPDRTLLCGQRRTFSR